MSSKFQRGSGVYTCQSCGKKTRETGLFESDYGICAYCYEVGGLENAYADGHITKEEYERDLAEYKKRYKRD